jgi:hypothetical protein
VLVGFPDSVYADESLFFMGIIREIYRRHVKHQKSQLLLQRFLLQMAESRGESLPWKHLPEDGDHGSSQVQGGEPPLEASSGRW